MLSDPSVELQVDGEKIEMNEFVKRILSGMITGAVETLRDVDKDWESITIDLKR